MPSPATDPHRLDRRRRVRRHGTFAAVLVVGLVVMAGAAYLFSDVYAAVTDDESIALLDQPTLRLAMQARSPWLDTALTVYTNVAGVIALPVLGLLVVVVLAVRRREWVPIVLGLSAGAGSLLMTQAGKELFGRDRPPMSDAVPPYETSASFPSGHTLNATVVVGIVAYLLVLRQTRRSMRALTITAAAVFALTIGLSRVYLGHHWLTDVVGAWLLALAWLAELVVAHRIWLRLGRPDQDEESE
ncbi:phosphatase PAP2 family protein [Frigoribacterium sp. PvP054]|uniref:phosphatase PAP2 family protein n=1 Tax=Frigoribacterium sp. PvP054 TaxID=3156438 RepID=UPI003398830F